MNYEIEEVFLALCTFTIVTQVENVYDVVDESEYAETVSKKREEDWIVDDDGGYVEDGREIFDDEEGDLGYGGGEGNGGKTKTKDKGEKSKKEGSKSANIKNMLLSMPSKKAVDQGKLEDDELLGDILSSIEAKKKVTTGAKKVGGKGTTTQQAIQRSGEVGESERNPFMVKGTGLKKVVKRQVAALPSSAVAQDLQGEESSTGAGVVDDDIGDGMEGFDDEMDFGEEMEEEKEEEAKVEVKEEGDSNRGFVSAKVESSSLGEGQWVSCGAGQQVKEEEVKVDSSSLPTVSVEGEEVLRMYWLDAHEDPYKHPGTVWLFGKVAVQPRKFVSCCVTVKNVPRRIYLAKV